MELGPAHQPTIFRPILLFFVIFIAFTIFSVLGMQLPVDLFTMTIAAQFIVILGGALIYRQFFAQKEVKWPGFRRLGMPVWGVGLVIVAAVVLGLLGNVLAALTVEVIPGLEEMAAAYQEQVERLLLSEGLRPQILGAISVALVAPLCEEVLFRGTILTEQRRAQSLTGAVVLNGVLFSAMHANPMAFVSLALIGGFLAHITLHSRAIWAAIIGHAALNTANGVVLPRVAEDLAAPEELAMSDILIALAILAPLSFFLWWLTIRMLRSHHEMSSSASA